MKKPLIAVICGLALAAIGWITMANTDMSCYHNYDTGCKFLGPDYTDKLPGSFGFGIFCVSAGGLTILVGLIALGVRLGSDSGPGSGPSKFWVDPAAPASLTSAPTDQVESANTSSRPDTELRLERLQQLALLRREGALSDLEFEQLKHDLLGRDIAKP
jgi:hypothetical protein